MVSYLVPENMLKHIIPLNTSAENEYAETFACYDLLSTMHVRGSILVLLPAVEVPDEANWRRTMVSVF